MSELFSFYAEAFRIATKSIIEHKLRAFLTLIGIIIGVAAVVVVGASINGLKTYVMERVSKLVGANHFVITRMQVTGKLSDAEFETMNRRNKDVTWEEYEFVKVNCKSCYAVAAEEVASADIDHFGVEMPSLRVSGLTPEMYEIEDKKLSEGRFFSSREVESGARVAVIGVDTKEKFFAESSPIGKSIKLRGISLTIIGVEEKRGSFLGNSLDRQLYIPITLHSRIFSRSGGLELHVGATDKVAFDMSIEEVRSLLRNRRHLTGSDPDTFSLVNFDEFNTQMDQFTAAIASVIVPITLIILVVGGIVVMNIMLVAVTERTFEVGLRKAIGATQKQILLQFLIESLILCLVGGLMGLLLAIGTTTLITAWAGISMTITFGYVLLSVSVSSGIGIVSGIYPAWKAARLDPITALTHS